jgi:hypothetical protein
MNLSGKDSKILDGKRKHFHGKTFYVTKTILIFPSGTIKNETKGTDGGHKRQRIYSYIVNSSNVRISFSEPSDNSKGKQGNLVDYVFRRNGT